MQSWRLKPENLPPYMKKSLLEHWPRELCLRRELQKVSMVSKAMSSAAARVGGMGTDKRLPL